MIPLIAIPLSGLLDKIKYMKVRVAQTFGGLLALYLFVYHKELFCTYWLENFVEILKFDFLLQFLINVKSKQIDNIRWLSSCKFYINVV
jgi:hypothetical protein